MFETWTDTVHGIFSKKGREPSGPVERTRELYGLTAENLELVTKLTKARILTNRMLGPHSD